VAVLGHDGECQVTPFPTRELASPGPAGADNIKPTVVIHTSGSVAPVAGQIVIEFDAADSGGLSLALLRLNETVSEVTLSGNAASASFATPIYSVGVANSYSISVYDQSGNRQNASTSVTPLSGFNQGPRPFFSVVRSQAAVDEPVILDATGSTDADHSSVLLTAEWDLDGDSIFDTMPATELTLVTSFSDNGPRHIRVRLADPADGVSVSTPIALRIGPFAACPGDLDGSGAVATADLLALLSSWGPCPGCPADLDGDGNVGTADLLVLLTSWGPCPGHR
jgi:hypothetical protein